MRRVIALFILMVLCLANTETFFLDRRDLSHERSAEECLAALPQVDLIAHLDSNGSGNIILHFDPLIETPPEDSQVRTAVVDASQLEEGFIYFMRVCYMGLSPINIAISEMDHQLLLFNVTTDYYSNDLEKASLILDDVEVRVRADPQNRIFGLLNDTLWSIITRTTIAGFIALFVAFKYIDTFLEVGEEVPKKYT